MSTVLFDEPGPRARRRHRIFTIVGAVVVAALVAVALSRLAGNGQFDGRRWEWIQYEYIQRSLLRGLGATLQAFAIAAVLSLVLGLVLSLGRLSTRPWLRWPATVVVTVFRALPVVVLMFFPYVAGRPLLGTAIPLLWCVVFGLTIYNGSVLAEIFRAGVLAVPRGQTEAAAAIGLRRGQTLRLVLFPQAIRSMLPTIVSQLVVVLKDTALGFVIGFHELLYQGNTVTAAGGRFQEPFIPVAIVVGAIYVVLCAALSALATTIERRTGARRRPPRDFQVGTAGGESAAAVEVPA